MRFLKVLSIVLAVALTFGGASAPAWAQGDPARGKKVFKKCAACHKLAAGKRAIGPSLSGLFGRAVGGLEKFRYSNDMKAVGDKGLVWDDETFLAFIENPKKFLGAKLGKKKGKTRMGFRGLRKQKDRDDLLAFLKQATK